MIFSQHFYSSGTDYSSFDHHVPAPYMRRSFPLDRKPVHAELTVCGLGFYRFFINGAEKTKGLLAPYISNPDEMLFYDLYDITDDVLLGQNVLGFLLGNGMLNCPGGQITDLDKAPWRSAPKLAFVLDVTFADGGRFLMEADGQIKCAPSPILFDDLRCGERYDARLEIPGWNLPEFDDSTWTNAIPAERPRGDCHLCEAEPVAVIKKLKPVRIYQGRIGKLPELHPAITRADPEGLEAELAGRIYDFGENNAGLCRLHIRAAAGQKIILQFCEETLPDGSGNLDLSAMTFLPPKYDHREVYICREGEQDYIPSFCYHGFRYVLVLGLTDEQATPDLLTYEVMSGRFEEIGGFSCSDDIINRIEAAALRSDRSNFYCYPTDCPQREKNGWTADAALSIEQMISRFRPDRSLLDWLRCIVRAQRTDGALPGIIPTDKWGYAWGNGPAWDSILIWLPYYLYQYRGDTECIRLSASAMLRYLHYLTTRRDSNGLIEIGLGDWCHTARPNDPLSPLIFTDSVISMDLCRRAEILFRTVDMNLQADFAHGLFTDLRTCVRRRLIDPRTLVARGSCQTSQAMALFFGVYEPGEEQIAFDVLVSMIERNDRHMDVGVLGGRVIFHVLSAFGRSDLAYEMIRTPSYPSYAYWFLEQNATTLFEDFYPVGAPTSSRNHHFWGDVISWFSRELAGIKVNPYLTDANEVLILPRFVPSLTHAEGYTALPCGRISVSWKRDGDIVLLRVEAPAGAVGRIEADNGWRFENGYADRPLASGEYRLIPETMDDTMKIRDTHNR